MENGTILPMCVRERKCVCVGERERPILLRAATEQALAEVYVVHICLRVCPYIYREVVYLWFAEKTSHREREISPVYQSGLQTGLKFPCKRGYREGEIHTHTQQY